jgi:hypothetical protein
MYINQYFIHISYVTTYKMVDKGFLEIFGPLSISKYLFNFSYFLSKMHTGVIYNYSFIFIVVLFFLFFVFLIKPLVALLLISIILFII